MASPAETPRSIAEKFLAQTESTALYGGKPGETIQELKPETRQEIVSLLDYEAARLFAEEKRSKEKTAKRVLLVDEVVTKGSNLEALMHLALLYKDEEANETITHNQQAAAFKVLRGMRDELLVQNGLRLNPTEVELENLSAEAKEHYARLKRLQGEVFTNITGWAPESFFDQEAVEKEMTAWKVSYEQSTGRLRKLWERVLTSKYKEKETATREELIEEQQEQAEWRFFDVEMIRFENVQRSIYRGRWPLHEQGEIMESIKQDLALERRAMYAELLTGEKRLKKDEAKKLAADAAETADDVLKDIVAEEIDIATKDESEFLNLFRTDGYDPEFARFIQRRGGVNRLQGMDTVSLFQFWLEWITYLIDLKNR